VELAVKGQLARPKTTTTSISTSSLQCGWMRSPGRAGPDWPAGPPHPAATAPLDGSHPRQGWPGRPEGWRQAWCHLPIPHHRLQSVKEAEGSLLGCGPRSGRRSGTAPGLQHDLADTDRHGGTSAAGSLNGLAGGADAAPGNPAPGRGPAVVAATRPIPRRSRAASRARGVPAGPPAAALDPGPDGAGRRPRRPPGRPGPGRSAASTPPPGDSAGIRLGCSGLASGWGRPRS
jgi:hypothetical protein